MRKISLILTMIAVVLTASAQVWKTPFLAPQKTEASAVSLELYNQNFCTASFTWFYYGDAYFAIGLFNEAKELVGGVVVTPDECDYITELDGVTFPSNEQNVYKYYFSTYWLLNADDIQKGDGWNTAVTKIGEGEQAYNALNEGTYFVQIYETNGYSMTSGATTLQFTLTNLHITDLKAEVSKDNTTATLTWKQPVLPKSYRLYISVQSEGISFFDNFSGTPYAESPLSFQVEPNRSYTVSAQVLNDANAALGSMVTTTFTVGSNPYEPKDLQAKINDGDMVTFSWKADEQADAYLITLYKDNVEYGTMTVNSTTKEMLIEPGTYTWTVTAFNLGEDEKYYPASEAIEGGKFTTTAASGESQLLNVTALEAVYADYSLTEVFPEGDSSIREGKYFWLIRLETGTTGFPRPWISIYTDYKTAISGTYSTELGNVDMQNCFMDINGNQENAIQATDVQLKLNFEHFSEEYLIMGLYYGVYSGSFKMTCTNGITYYGNFTNQWCNSYLYEYWLGTITTDADVKMYEEEQKLTPLENINKNETLDPSQPMYNVLGQKVDADYKGIVIQKGRKYIIK